MPIGRWILKRFLMPYWLLARGTTLGVRAIVVDSDERILLVRHTYMTGWFLPGGGVDTGETLDAAIRRELLEEANVTVEGEVELIGFYHNPRTSKRDHVGLFLCRDWQQKTVPKPNMEIAETGFFALEDLPDEATKGTRARLNEVFHGQKKSIIWS